MIQRGTVIQSAFLSAAQIINGFAIESRDYGMVRHARVLSLYNSHKRGLRVTRHLPHLPLPLPSPPPPPLEALIGQQ